MSVALAIPHTPWAPERVESLQRLQRSVGDAAIFSEREPNWSWSAKLWRWGAERGDDHLLQLQDDVEAPINFWSMLDAMLRAVPDKIIGLQGAHPAFRALAREGHRWAISRAWMVGVGYVLPRADLLALLTWRDALPAHVVQTTNEDDLISRFCVETGRDVWHPIPTIIDHDTDVPSSYGNDRHLHRRPTVTWREYGARELLEPSFWRVPAEPPVVQNPHGQTCWFCYSEPGLIASGATGARIGRACMAKGLGALLGVGT